MDPAGGLYGKLEERILARDRSARARCSTISCEPAAAGGDRPRDGPYPCAVHDVPYHQRIDDGFVRFVNNDHCLLSARTSLRLPRLLSPGLEYLPLAQTIWYVPTGLDPWNQPWARCPATNGGRGQSAIRTSRSRRRSGTGGSGARRPRRAVRGAPHHWLTLVQRGEVLEAYRVFLGLFQRARAPARAARPPAFAGLIDVQDRMLYNRSYTTGHKAHRARATIEIGEAVGWDDAHDVLYAGALDMAVGPAVAFGL